jgi:hypothetical protein
MQTDYPVDQWVSELGRHYDIADLRLNEQGIMALSIGDGLSVHMQAIADSQTVVFYAAVIDMGDTLRPELLVSMLQANRFWHETGGATLSLDDRQPPRAILAQPLRFQDLDTPRLIEAFENFSGALQAMHEWLTTETQGTRIGGRSPDLMQMA